ncbi:signal peptide peptidase SppA [Flavihumibacter cheonanensis]|uniref:signal peptide peptidase SppA n=1 Tax=Flavihumibacter cheonanensis TaxID=1442385 RepID=UPI001EF83ABC|nr:signal peptide peptidase SppA [Flavihumibacter cheonanensis]MCG7751833.1 signal peptide peptidase SppA [Flavihumibacter cheonanensis]
MAQFFKYFFAALLALFVFSVLAFFVLIGIAGAVASKEAVQLEAHSVLYLDLGKALKEQTKEDPFALLEGEEPYSQPGVYDMVQLLKHAANNDQVDGLYLKAGSNANGFATNAEIRKAIAEFKEAGKFVIAYGEVIPQQAFYVASAAEKLYCHPKGGLEWTGLGMEYVFFKKALDRLDIEPQIFYAGKFKSATEPFREEKMTEPNKIQSRELLEGIYGHMLETIGDRRKLEVARLRNLADSNLVRTASDAEKLGLLDGMRYEDEVKEEIRRKTGAASIDKIKFVSLAKYAEAVSALAGKGTDRITVIYAEGNIVDGEGDEGQIGGKKFMNYIRKARLDAKTKAIVIRINSGGGSAMASENMWREIELAKKDKPVIVSFGDVAASGGYYMACGADSIFAQPNTITGSIGVFSIVPNMQGFFSDKLGVTFDGVKTGPYANSPSVTEPLSPLQKKFFQEGVDSIYQTFLSRVAEGRKMPVAAVDSIGQGRIWTGTQALKLGLVDRMGGMEDALAAAAKLAKLDGYRIRQFPERVNWLERLTGNISKDVSAKSIRKTIGEDWHRVYEQWQSLQEGIGTVQARLPFELIFH